MSSQKGSLHVHPPSADDDGSRAIAFRAYVEPQIEVLLRVGTTITGSVPDAEDLVQETLIRAFRALDRFDGRHPRAWLLTILRNTNLNMHRRRRPDLVEDWNAIASARPAFGDVPSSPEEECIDEILDGDLAAAVQGLDPRFRTALLLIDVDQLTYAEAADVLGVPIGTVMSRLSRARNRVGVRLLHSSTHHRRIP